MVTPAAFWYMLVTESNRVRAYPVWQVLGALNTFAQSVLAFFFWTLVSGSKEAGAGFVSYIVVARLLYPLFEWGSLRRLATDVYDGNISVRLLKPIDYQLNMWTTHMAAVGTAGLYQSLPCLIAASLLFHIGPASISVLPIMLLSLIVGITIGFLVDYIFAAFAFLFHHMWGLWAFRVALVQLLTGAIIPLTAFPASAQRIFNFLPFRSMLHVPVSLYVGQLPPGQALPSVLLQIGWLLALLVLSRWVWALCFKRLTVNGG